MDNEAVSCPTHRIIGEPGPSLQHAVISGCGLWLVLDPRSHEQALARLYEYEPDADIAELFHTTQLQNLHDISPRVAPIEPQSPMLRWLFDENPRNWGMVLASDATQDEILDHLRSLLLVKTDGESVILRIWDGSVLNSLCSALPEEIPFSLAPCAAWWPGRSGRNGPASTGTGTRSCRPRINRDSPFRAHGTC